MFTGIVEAQGRIVAVKSLDDSSHLTFEVPSTFEDVSRGDSISVNGVCLTAVDIDRQTVTADVMGQTLKFTNLGSLAVGDSVNLERAMQPASRFGGHMVQGHVDAVSHLISHTEYPQWRTLRFELPASIAKYVVERGSITVNGVSLTVSAVDNEDVWFEVSLIPTTLSDTNLGVLKTGESVNLESDVVARHVEKLIRAKNV
ncbi:MAG: hypothetical protein RL410_60 [Actinomycetota bacterium]|jgi:riboflavin synthase